MSDPICYYLSLDGKRAREIRAFQFCGRSGIIDDKLSAAELVVGLLQRCHKIRLAVDVDAHGHGRRYITSDDLLVTILKPSSPLAQRKLSLQRE